LGNNLTITANTEIALGGTSSGAVGQLILNGDANACEIKLIYASTSVVSTGNTAGANPFGGAVKIGNKTFAAGTGGAAAIYTVTNGATGKFAKLLGGTANKGLKGGSTSSDTVTIDTSLDVTT
jgi:hypothetical protein